MIKKISKTTAIKEKLREEGKTTFLDAPHHIAAIIAMNKRLEVVRRDYQTKDRNSQLTAANIILNA